MSDEARTMARYVRPIYDAIDSRQYKAAIKLCAHKKVAHLDIVLVLKAHCLERTGKPDEALEIVRAVQKKNPTDDTLLSTMSLVFRLCGCEHEMLPTIEYACAHTEPPNEELYQTLFVAYTRKGDFLKQQQTALKMFKAFGNIKYVCWAALSMLLQVNHAGAPAKMLGLADRMLLKTMRETKSGDGEALQLLVHILQLQDKHDEALQVFDEFVPHMAAAKAAEQKAKDEAQHHHHHHDGGPCGHSHAPVTAKGRSAEGEGAYDEEIQLGPMQVIDRLTLEASLTKTVNNWERSATVNKTLLEQHNADDWTYLTELIHARFQQLAKPADLAKVEKELIAFLGTLPTMEGNSHLRGPWLALVHVQSEKLQYLQKTGDKKSATATETALVDAILAYIERLYTKACCFSDVKQYLALFDAKRMPAISADARTRLVKTLQEMATTAKATTKDSDAKRALNQLNRRLFSLKALRFLGIYADSTQYSVGDLKSLVQSLVEEYNAASWLNLGSQGGQREVQYTDDLLLLAAHTLIDMYQRDPKAAKSYDALIEAAALLEYGLEKSAYNFQMKLLLSRVYAYVAACDAMLVRHRELDVKHVQLDSLSFLVLDKLLQLGHHADARRICDSIRRLHWTTNNDTPEYISRAYRLGVYSKVLDLTRFLHNRMRKSHTLAIARGELLQFELQDALAGGPAKFAELATSSQQFQEAITELDAMLTGPLSTNQHREVVVSWSSEPVVRTGDSFASDGARLIECDRSADLETSKLWIQLQLVVPKFVRAVLGGDEITTLTEQYESLIGGLKLTSGDNVKAKIWLWSRDAIGAAGATATALQDTESSPNWKPITQKLEALVAPLQAIREQLATGLTTTGRSSALSAYGVSALGLVLHDAGLWAAAALCAVMRVSNKKRAKKDDAEGTACLSALRGVVKQIQDVLTGLETDVKSLTLAAESSPLAIVSSAPPSDLVLAHEKAQTNVAHSHATLQALLSDQLRTAATSIRGMLQK